MKRLASMLFGTLLILCCVSAAAEDFQKEDFQKELLAGWYGEDWDYLRSPYEFPDKRTEELMRSMMRCSEDQSITNWDISNVRSVYLEDRTLEETLEYISVLKYFPNLASVDIINCGLKEIPKELCELPIRCLQLYGNDLRDISGLEKMKGLTQLGLTDNNFITDYSPLAGLENLLDLGISMFSTQDISAIKHCKNLRSISLTGSYGRIAEKCSYSYWTYSVPLTDVSVLEELPALEEVLICNFSEISENATEQIESFSADVDFEIRSYDGEVRDLYSDLVNGVNGEWRGEGVLRGLSKEDVLDFYEQQSEKTNP